MAHDNVFRRDKSPYLSHPISVVDILADLKMDDIGLVAGFLHDTVEDNTVVKIEKIKEIFGEEVAHIVESVTKVETNINLHKGFSKDEAQNESLRKLIFGTVKDVRVIFVKIADRLHNLRTMESMPIEKAKIKAEECLTIFAPIANRLGLGKVKNELEDLSFKYINSEEYEKIVNNLNEKRRYSDNFIYETQEQISHLLKENNIQAEITGRVKHIYSIYKKLKKQGIGIDEVYDYMAFRILVNEESECYTVLGLIHSKWNHIPSRLKDFISKPKENGYRSLHTSVLSEKGQPFEVQIRTYKMHEEAENGIAAHWKYKEGKVVDLFDDKILERFKREIQEITPDAPKDFVKTLSENLSVDQIYVFTPKGQIIHLPPNATALDFAYYIHTELGHHCGGAKVNGKLVPIKTPLKSEDIVEIIKNNNVKPSHEWLEYVTTQRAKSKIKSFLAQNEKALSVERGKEVFERELRRLKLSTKLVENDENFKEGIKKSGYPDLDSLYAEIGYGKVEARAFLKRILHIEEKNKEPQAKKRKGESIPVTTSKGESDYFINVAKCCNPVKGEGIIGYVTVGKGLVIHKVNCVNIKRLSKLYPQKIHEVSWDENSVKNCFEIPLTIIVKNRMGMLAEVTKIISQQKADIVTCDARALEKQGIGEKGIIKLKLMVSNKRHLNNLLQKLSHIDGVLTINRV